MILLATRILLSVFVTTALVGCGTPDHVASFEVPGNLAVVSVELVAAHPYLAEYDRTIRVRTRDGIEGVHALSMDTGGYAAINVYACVGNFLMLDSFDDIVRVDVHAATFSTERCHGVVRYLGVFDGGGSTPWRFHPACKRAEAKLEMRGG